MILHYMNLKEDMKKKIWQNIWFGSCFFSLLSCSTVLITIGDGLLEPYFSKHIFCHFWLAKARKQPWRGVCVGHKRLIAPGVCETDATEKQFFNHTLLSLRYYLYLRFGAWRFDCCVADIPLHHYFIPCFQNNIHGSTKIHRHSSPPCLFCDPSMTPKVGVLLLKETLLPPHLDKLQEECATKTIDLKLPFRETNTHHIYIHIKGRYFITRSGED